MDLKLCSACSEDHVGRRKGDLRQSKMAQPVHNYLATETAKTVVLNTFHLPCKSMLDGRTGILELNTSKNGCDISHCIMISYLKAEQHAPHPPVCGGC